MADEKKVGKVTHFYTKLNVGIFLLSGPLVIGDMIHVKGATTDFTQKVDSMQLDRKDVEKGKKGDEVGVKVKEKVRGGDEAFLVK